MDDQQQPSESENIPSSSSNDGVLLVKIEEMVKTHLSQIKDLDEQITKHKEMVDDVFANDETFQEHDKVAKEAVRIRSKTKSEIMKRSDVATLSNKLKDLKSERSELQEGLSDYLREYQRLSGLNEIEGIDGEIMEIVYQPKLVRKSAFRP